MSAAVLAPQYGSGGTALLSPAFFDGSGPSPVVVNVTDAGAIPSAEAWGAPSIYAVLPSSLVYEDGSGLPNAESYASVSAADAYHAARSNIGWAELSTFDKESSLRKATDYMLERFGGTWRGDRVSSVQALDWPRYGATLDGYLLASDIVPKDVIRACCVLALKASKGDLTADETAQVKSKTVGPISVTYADGARQNTRFAAVENMLRPLLSGGGGSIKVIRA